MFELFALTGIWFWLVNLLIFGMFIFAAENDLTIGAIFGFIITLLAYQFIFGYNVFGYIWQNPATIFMYIAGYAIGGAAWSFYKWRSYCKKNPVTKKAREDAAESWSRDKSKPKEQFTDNDFYTNPYYFALHPANHYSRLMNWIVLWPFSLFWALLNDPIRWFGEKVYSFMYKTYLKVAIGASK